MLSSELASAKDGLENTQEELRNVTADKRSAQQQQTYWEGEAKRIAGERDGLAKVKQTDLYGANKCKITCCLVSCSILSSLILVVLHQNCAPLSTLKIKKYRNDNIIPLTFHLIIPVH